MASYQTFPQAETNELPAKKHSQASTIAVMVTALCLGAAYVSTTTGPARADEFFTGGGDEDTPDDADGLGEGKALRARERQRRQGEKRVPGRLRHLRRVDRQGFRLLAV